LPIKKDTTIFLWEGDINAYIARKKGIQTTWGRRYWKVVERLLFSEDFYTNYVKPAKSYEEPEPRRFLYPLTPLHLNDMETCYLTSLA
jgi:hypothetical protein